jgi:hypothetical protein
MPKSVMAALSSHFRLYACLRACMAVSAHLTSPSRRLTLIFAPPPPLVCHLCYPPQARKEYGIKLTAEGSESPKAIQVLSKMQDRALRQGAPQPGNASNIFGGVTRTVQMTKVSLRQHHVTCCCCRAAQQAFGMSACSLAAPLAICHAGRCRHVCMHAATAVD